MGMLSVSERVSRLAKGRVVIVSTWVVAIAISAGFCCCALYGSSRTDWWDPNGTEASLTKGYNVTSALLTILSLDPAVESDSWRTSGSDSRWVEHAGIRKPLQWVPEKGLGYSHMQPYVRTVNPEAEAFPALQKGKWGEWVGSIVVEVGVGNKGECSAILRQISKYRGILENFEMTLPRVSAGGAAVRWLPIDPRVTESPDRVCMQQYLGEQFIGQKDELWFRPIDRTSKNASLSDAISR